MLDSKSPVILKSLAVSSLVADAATPVTLPVTLPVKFPTKLVAVTIPLARIFPPSKPAPVAVAGSPPICKLYTGFVVPIPIDLNVCNPTPCATQPVVEIAKIF